MTKLLKLADNLRKIDISEYYLDALRLPQVAEFIPEAIRNRLFNKGTDGFSKELRTDSAKEQGNRSYAGFTYQEKRRKGQRARNVTLRDTGAFYGSIHAQVPFKSVKVSANFGFSDEHIYRNFQTSYSSEKEFEDAILRLTVEEQRELNQRFLFPVVSARVKRAICV